MSVRLAHLLVLALLTGVVVAAPVRAQEPPPPTRSANWAIERVSVAPDGAEADGDSWNAALNRDGTKMAFTSTASNLGATGGGEGGEVYLKDFSTGVLEHVDIDSAGGHMHYSGAPDLSADGRYVAFDSGWGYWSRVYRRDRDAQSTVQASSISPAVEPVISADGTRLAFRELDDYYYDSDDRVYGWVHDAATGGSRRVAEPSDLSRYVSRMELSGDGTTAAYTIAGEWPGPRELFVRDVSDLDALGAPVLIDAAALSVYVQPALSHDGRYLVYADWPHVRWRDLHTGEDVVVGSADELDGDIQEVDVSDDGRNVAYTAWNYRTDRVELWWHSRDTGRSEFIADIGDYSEFELSGDGRSIAFSAYAEDVVPGDANRMQDVFIARRSDVEAPVFAADAALRADEVGTTVVQLGWDAATDDTGVVGYEVLRDGAVAETVDGRTTRATVSGLAPGGRYRFAVRAVDAAARVSVPLELDVETLAHAEPGDAALLVADEGAGRVRLAWDAASGDGLLGYRLWRASGEGEFAIVADIDAATTNYLDEGLDAETTYRWLVSARREAGVEPHTREATLTTAPLSAQRVVWEGRPNLRTDLTITITAVAGWRGFADVTYRTWFAEDGTALTEPRAATTTLEATEVEPGRYVATFPLVEGIAEVTAITAGIADGAGHRAALAAARLPLVVHGALAVDVDAPDGALPGARLVVSGGNTTRQAQIDGGAEGVLLAPLPPAEGYEVKVLAADGRELASVVEHVDAGRTGRLSVKPVLPATLTVDVVDDKGVPVADAEVRLREVGRVLTVEKTTSGGRASFLRLLEGQQLDVEVVAPGYSRVQGSVTQSVRLAAGANEVDTTLAALPSSILSGVVTLDQGDAAREATVAVHQQVDGRSWSWTAVTDDDGRYRIDALAGKAAVTVSYRHDPAFSAGDVELPAGGEARRDVVLPAPTDYQLEIELYTREAGQPEQGPLPIDWRVAVHMGMQVTTPTASISPRSDVVTLTGQPGDEVQVCASGHEAQYGADCDALVLGTAKRVTAELHLEREARVRGRIVGADGKALDGSVFPSLTVSRVLADGRIDVVRRAAAAPDGTFDIALVQAGDHVLDVSLRRYDGSSWSVSRRLRFTAAPDDVTDLGVVAVTVNPWVAGSSVTPLQRTVLPGGTATLRVLAQPEAVGEVAGASLRVPLPAGTSFVASSVAVDGQPVDAQAEEGVVVVALPTRTFAEATPGWSVQLAVRLDDVAPGAELRLPATVAWTWHDAPREHLLGVGVVHAAGVTLDVRSTSATLQVPLSGRAPADALVSVFDGTRLVGQVIASPGGVWKLNAQLPDFGDGADHRLTARVDVDGTALVSDQRNVRVDTRYPELARAVLRQPDGRAVRIDPAQGTARFPYVVAMGSPFTVDLEFAGRGTVEGVRASVGTSSGAARQTGPRSFSATVGSSTLGPVSASFTPVPASTGLSDQPKPDEDALRDRLPAAFSDFTDMEMSSSTDPVTGARTGTLSVAVPAAGPEARLTTTMTIRRGLTYTPTATDLARARETGVTMYGFSSSGSVQSDGATVTMSAYVPEDQLDDPEALGAAFLQQASRRPPAAEPGAHTMSAAGAQTVARVGFQFAFSRAQEFDSFWTAITTGGKYDQLNGLLDWVSDNCSGPAASRHREKLDQLNRDALLADMAHVNLMLAGAAFAPVTFGVGTLVVWGITFAADKLVDHVIDEAISEAAQAIRSDDECRDDDDDDDRDDDDRDDDDPRDPLADPVWIHDPSGYVYEGLESNRVAGVTATVLQGETAEGPFAPWDADWFGQSNPLSTGADGRYGWDVPEGWWQVVYAKEGYEPAASNVLRVLPPHFDVNVGIVSYAAPTVTSVTAVSGESSAVDVTFDKPMQLATAQAVTVTDADGEALGGEVVSVAPETAPEGQQLALAFRFLPEEPLTAGASLTVVVDEGARSYADRPLAVSVTEAVVVTSPPAPVLRPLVVTKTAASERVRYGDELAYAISVANPNDVAVTVTDIVDDLPRGFGYVTASTTGVTTADPAQDGRRLRWAVDAGIPAGGALELRFDARAGGEAGIARNEATAVAVGAPVTATGPTAPVLVEPRPTALDADPLVLRVVPSPAVTLGTFSAVLTEDDERVPIPGRALRFLVGDDVICGGETDAAGRASCSAPLDAVTAAAAAGGYRVVFDGDGAYEPSEASAPLVVGPTLGAGASRAGAY